MASITKKYIDILNQCEPTDVEQRLLDVNIKLLSTKYYSVKKCAVDGINRLINQVHFRIGVINLLSQANFKVLII